MRVYLIRTPEVKNDIFNNVYEFLSSFSGEIEFVKSVNQFYKSDFEKVGLGAFYQHYYLKIPIDKEESPEDSNFEMPFNEEPRIRNLSELIEIYRKRLDLEDRNIVILLTDFNGRGRFSQVYSKGNLGIVYGQFWDEIISYNHKNYKLALAHEIIGVTLRVFMRSSISDSLHYPLRGCVNDKVRREEELSVKLRTADICNFCCDIIEREKISDKFILHILNILDGIRTQLLFRMKFNRRIQPVAISVNENNKILLPSLGNLEIKLTPLFKTLFIFYLNHTEGISFSDLKKYKDELNKLYRKLNKRIPDKEIGLTIDMVLNKETDFFSINKSRLNSAITKQLGEPLAFFYKISGKPREAFKINVPKELITIHINALSAFRNQV